MQSGVDDLSFGMEMASRELLTDELFKMWRQGDTNGHFSIITSSAPDVKMYLPTSSLWSI
jgi:hypothetical protein